MKACAPQYDPQKTEDAIYALWEDSGFFNPDNLPLQDNAEHYAIVMPPPNVTGTLHMGHAGMLAYEDALIRYHRMCGKRTVWIPGTDHAAIATQTKVEKNLKKEGLTRHVLGREKFLKHVHSFAQGSHDTIVQQIKKIGSSCDWSREAFTLDDTRSAAVSAVFTMMYNDGLIYRGERIVNWCPRCSSTLADDEVEHADQSAQLYTFRYDAQFPIPIATTRPETKLGDTAVAVHPKDERYKQYIGQTFNACFLGTNLTITVIADHSIDMDFGTGALGVTPAHSVADWQMAEKNDLKIIKVIDESGRIKEGFGEFSGLATLEARTKIVHRIKEENLLITEEEISNALSLCYRCDTPIEPLPSLQWFINVNKKSTKLQNKTIKEISSDAVQHGVFGHDKITIIPHRFEKNYFHWMNDLRDWCISRQIWYGHRIPVWYCSCGEMIVATHAPQYCAACNNTQLTQDPDTLDTWFSSGLWTFSTLAHHPSDITLVDNVMTINTPDMKHYHPTAVLETGYDILFFWVARMIIMTTYAIGEIPFRDVYLHGLVLDERGKKMSKSLGNVIDPLDMIATYGTDATRLTLIAGSTPGNDLKISTEKIKGHRNFVNKLWNISRFILSKSDTSHSSIILDQNDMTVFDRMILEKMRNTIRDVRVNMERYRFAQAIDTLQQFTWDDFANWYIEVAKFEKNATQKDLILTMILEDLLALWHPFIPFVTEQIWQNMEKETCLMITPLPTERTYSDLIGTDDLASIDAAVIQETISAIRNLVKEHAPQAKNIHILIDDSNRTIGTKHIITTHCDLIMQLRTSVARIDMISDKKELPSNTASHITRHGVTIIMPLTNVIDTTSEKLKKEKELFALQQYISTLAKKLNNAAFVNNAPEKIVEAEKEKLRVAQDQAAEITLYLDKLSQ